MSKQIGDLSPKQEAVIIGSMLGDGFLQTNRGVTKKTRFRVSHSKAQSALVDFTRKPLENLCQGVQGAHNFQDHGTNARKFYTADSSVLNPYHEFFYEKGVNSEGQSVYVKVLRPNLIHYLKNPLSLAIWFADDGTKRKDCDAARIATQGFSLEENQLLVSILDENFGVQAKIDVWQPKRKRTYYGLALLARGNHFAKFRSLIVDIIRQDLPDFMYKLYS